MHGLFVRERILALAKLVHLRVVAPVPWFPRLRGLGERYYRYSLTPLREDHNGTAVDHPRFLTIPKLCKGADAALLAAGSLAHLQKLRVMFPFDIIDSHWAYPDGAAAAMLASRLGARLAITVRGDDLNIFLNHFWRKAWIRWALRKADLIIALSTELKDIVAAAGVSPTRIAVIRNGINPENFYPIDRKVARGHLGLPADGRFLLAVGRLHLSKGYPMLIGAAGRLLSNFPDLRIFIVGEPDHEADARPSIHRAAIRHNIVDRVHLVGAQDPALLKYWYGAADLFCLPTSREGSANVLLEAMACGLPCITTPVGGNLDVIKSREVGILVSPDVESMAQAIGTGLTQSWDTARISEHGRRRTWQRVGEECRNHLLTTLDSSCRGEL